MNPRDIAKLRTLTGFLALVAYLGNVLGHRYENTYCPKCGELLIRRWGLSVTQYRLKDKKCPRCGRAIPVVTELRGT